MRIGELAAAASVNVQTIRYYERRGVVPTPRRSASGYRQYAGDAVRRMRFIKRAQELGFSLNEIEELLALRVRSGDACAAVLRKTRAKSTLVEQKIRDLQRLKRTLQRLAEACAKRRPTEECPILETLDHRAVTGR